MHVRDVAQANLAAARWAADPVAGAFRAFNVGSGTPHTVGELAAELSRVMDGPQPQVTGEYRLCDVRQLPPQASGSAASFRGVPRAALRMGSPCLTTRERAI